MKKVTVNVSVPEELKMMLIAGFVASARTIRILLEHTAKVGCVEGCTADQRHSPVDEHSENCIARLEKEMRESMSKSNENVEKLKSEK